eukprot:scaffold11018_cov64-Phaeocystis_antarctica.AAC.2
MIVGGDARGMCTRGEPLVGCEESVDTTVVLVCTSMRLVGTHCTATTARCGHDAAPACGACVLCICQCSWD